MLGNRAIHKIIARLERRERTPAGSHPRAGGAWEVARPQQVRTWDNPERPARNCGADAYDTPGVGSASVFTPCHDRSL